MKKEINHKWFYPHPPAMIWDYLTKPELLSQWLMPNDIQPVVGHLFQFRINPMPQMELDGVIYCEVLEVIPHKRLTYSWKSGPGEGKITVDSLVAWTLTPKDNGTELIVNHSGFTGNENLMLYTAMDQGWLKNIQKMGELLTISK